MENAMDTPCRLTSNDLRCYHKDINRVAPRPTLAGLHSFVRGVKWLAAVMTLPQEWVGSSLRLPGAFHH